MRTLAGGVVAIIAFGVGGCDGGESADSEPTGTTEQAVQSCTGPNQVLHKRLADFATAWAAEMGQLNATEQFKTVQVNGVTQLALTTYGSQICATRGGCPWVNTFLALQTLPGNPVFPDGVLNVANYRNWLVTYYGWARANVYSRIANGYWTDLPEDNSVSLIGADGTATCGTPWYSFNVHRDFHLTFSSTGPITGQYCIAVNDPIDPHGWSDNYLCSPRDFGFRWSSSGAIAGMYCTHVWEPWDPDGWDNNYLCTPEDFGLTYSYAGLIPGKTCLLTNEPSDPWGWWDNYLCWDSTVPLNHPSTLWASFLMFGGSDNPYLDFVVTADDRFKVDPTDYSSGSINTSTVGTCVVNLPLYSLNPAVEGACCFLDGKYGYLVQYTTRAHTYYCKNR